MTSNKGREEKRRVVEWQKNTPRLGSAVLVLACFLDCSNNRKEPSELYWIEFQSAAQV